MPVKDGPACPGCGLANYEGLCPHCRGDLPAYEEELVPPFPSEREPAPEDVADRTETQYEPTGGGFRNALGKLRTLELIEGRGEIRISEVFDG